VFEIAVTARPGQHAEEIEKAIDEELAAFRKDGPLPPELERAQKAWKKPDHSRSSAARRIGGIADRLNEYNHYLGTPDYLQQDLARYRNATVASIRRLLRSN